MNWPTILPAFFQNLHSFGCMKRGPITGIIYNNEMLDFATFSESTEFAPSEANIIEPGKRPMSSMCPALVLNSRGDVELAIGTAGGILITSTNAYVSITGVKSKRAFLMTKSFSH